MFEELFTLPKLVTLLSGTNSLGSLLRLLKCILKVNGLFKLVTGSIHSHVLGWVSVRWFDEGKKPKQRKFFKKCHIAHTHLFGYASMLLSEDFFFFFAWKIIREKKKNTKQFYLPSLRHYWILTLDKLSSDCCILIKCFA